mmetsp:Transcript_34424/g.72094  ORF Transcript_34424/g.72094 Transcript_34424/m.72094 type:complete len:82 (+) Transcript_34424:663-908(+)
MVMRVRTIVIYGTKLQQFKTNFWFRKVDALGVRNTNRYLKPFYERRKEIFTSNYFEKFRRLSKILSSMLDLDTMMECCSIE